MMRVLLIKLALLTLLCGLSCALYGGFLANGRTDAFYLRFTAPPQKSLVLGSSRGAQGIVPAVFNESGLAFDGPLYNLSFTLSSSPYGPVYREFVERKLSREATGGLFLLEVSPLALSESSDLPVGSAPTEFPEKDILIGKVRFNSARPNFEYLARCYKDSFYKIAWNHFREKKMLLHDDGWLEVTVPMDSASVARRTRSKVEDYRDVFAKNRLSEARLEALEETIQLLLPRGRVFLVRLPISDELRQLEEPSAPQFDARMTEIAARNGIRYLNLFPESGRYATTDGNHLGKESARRVSQEILRRIEANF
jgi:hypothetical protein